MEGTAREGKDAHRQRKEESCLFFTLRLEMKCYVEKLKGRQAKGSESDENAKRRQSTY
jgi:hypothetical protein